ncbi:winged helix-turn-helix domain-containing protein [Hoeflea sp. TYP-13]|uniref:winged helix-turn-helix domain-containing protein n=1 Tax=Hoeflea sp. TYP-13 TaxID=3230023 RepID=UPI0034C5C56B
MHILVLEDDAALGPWIVKGLTEAGHIADLLSDGRQALVAATTRDYDVLILDRMTPELDGLSTLKAIRAARISTPALFLTAMAEVEDRVEGFEAGCDDYLVKPFAFSELLARVGALGRRRGVDAQHEETKLSHGDLELDLISRVCKRRGQAIDLNPKEFQLLETFLRNRGRILTRTMLLERIWQMNFDPTTSVVETHISRLRAKIEKPFGDQLIRTVRGAGYVVDKE